MTMKDAERTVQYVQSDRDLFVAGAKCRGYENGAGPDLPMRTSEQSRHSLRSRKHDRLYALSLIQGQSFSTKE